MAALSSHARTESYDTDWLAAARPRHIKRTCSDLPSQVNGLEQYWQLEVLNPHTDIIRQSGHGRMTVSETHDSLHQFMVSFWTKTRKQHFPKLPKVNAMYSKVELRDAMVP